MFGRVQPNSKEILFHVKEVALLLCLTFSSITGMDTAGPSRICQDVVDEVSSPLSLLMIDSDLHAEKYRLLD